MNRHTRSKTEKHLQKAKESSAASPRSSTMTPARGAADFSLNDIRKIIREEMREIFDVMNGEIEGVRNEVSHQAENIRDFKASLQ